MDLPSTILMVIGAVTAIVGLVRLAAYFHHYALYKFSFKKYRGDWAVVTGASGGIGAGMVLGLAKRGINPILIARSATKMEELAARCEKEYKVQTKVISFDFSSASASDYKALLSTLATEFKPTILINNVGINVEMPTDLVQMETEHSEEISNMVKVNILSTTTLTRGLLPGMISQSRGIILCLSSAGGVVTPAPLLSPYAGTKAFNDSFAVSLNGEVSHLGIHVHSLTPFFVETAMAKMRSSMTVPTAKHFADIALNKVGSPYPRLQPYWVHYVMQLFITAFPANMQVKYVTDRHRNTRKCALRKKEKLAKQALAGKS